MKNILFILLFVWTYVACGAAGGGGRFSCLGALCVSARVHPEATPIIDDSPVQGGGLRPAYVSPEDHRRMILDVAEVYLSKAQKSRRYGDYIEAAFHFKYAGDKINASYAFLCALDRVKKTNLCAHEDHILSFLDVLTSRKQIELLKPIIAYKETKGINADVLKMRLFECEAQQKKIKGNLKKYTDRA
ncbi:hypothetical protein EBQ93_00605 [bacterium]|nr:hypothetical protein [bacterium]